MQYAEVVDCLVEAVPEIRDDVDALRAYCSPEPAGAYNVLDEVWSNFIIRHLLSGSPQNVLAGSWGFAEALAESNDPECRALACELLSQLHSEGAVALARPHIGRHTAVLLAELQRVWSELSLPWWRRLFKRGAA